MGVKTEYRKLDMYKQYLTRLIKDKATFQLCETSFTKKIKVDNYVFIFNEKGEQDGKLLQLISRVRNDAEGYNLDKLPKGELTNNWFDLVEKPEETIIAKVDVKSAYWETAIKMGVISDETNDYLKKSFTEGPEYKLARLKALGSLATRKTTILYESGVKIHSSQKIQSTRQLYLYICSVLDEIMQGACYNLAGAFYYYWDCVFVSEKYHKDVMQFLYDYDYGSKVELTQLSVIELGVKKYLVTGSETKLYVAPADLKQYPIPQEKQWLLN